MAVSLSGGVNKVTVTGGSSTTLVDRLTVTPTEGTLPARTYEARHATLAGSATLTPLSLATGGTAITGIGGDPGNGNTATFTVTADRTGLYALRVRYSNPEQSEATHYNPDPLARHADITVNGGEMRRVSFPHTFHQNNFWELTVPVHLEEGTEHDHLPLRGTAELRRHHLRLGHLPRRTAPLPLRAADRPDHRRAVRTGGAMR